MAWSSYFIRSPFVIDIFQKAILFVFKDRIGILGSKLLVSLNGNSMWVAGADVYQFV